MNWLPPRIVRRLVVAPLVMLLCLGWLALTPALLAVGAIIVPIVDRKARLLRVVTFAAVYVALEIVSIVALFGIWIWSGFGLRMAAEHLRSAHLSYMRWWLTKVNAAAARLFGLRINIEDPPQRKPGPVLVFSRHAGPGNSLMLIGTVMIAYQREPRIVMLAKLQWDPFFDIIGNRLPNRFIRHDPSQRDRSLEVIAELAAGTPEMGAFVLFPEGRDFTSKLRQRAIAHLRRRGYTKLADRAERMRRVLPPRHGGVHAAVNAAPEADVVFVAHTVLEDMGPLSDLWRRIPFDDPVDARYWRIPASEVPREQEALIEWLYEWWARIDAWIEVKIEEEEAGANAAPRGDGEAAALAASAEPETATVAPDPGAGSA